MDGGRRALRGRTRRGHRPRQRRGQPLARRRRGRAPGAPASRTCCALPAWRRTAWGPAPRKQHRRRRRLVPELRDGGRNRRWAEQLTPCRRTSAAPLGAGDGRRRQLAPLAQFCGATDARHQRSWYALATWNGYVPRPTRTSSPSSTSSDGVRRRTSTTGSTPAARPARVHGAALPAVLRAEHPARGPWGFGSRRWCS